MQSIAPMNDNQQLDEKLVKITKLRGA